MKIGIVTLSVSVNNYGGLLQAYALKRLLIEWGHDAEIIDKRQCPVVDLASRGLKDYLKIPYHIFLRIKKSIITGKRVPIFHSEWYYLISKSNVFLEERIKPRYIQTWKDIKRSDYNAIIAGSDQVWRPMYFSHIFGDIRNAFLFFAKDWEIKKISYAPSFGMDSAVEFNSEELQACRSALKSFSGISVREYSGLNILNEKFGVSNAVKVLDPVMLLDASHYSFIADNGTVSPEGELLCYILDENPVVKDVVAYIRRKKGLMAYNPLKNLFNEEISLLDRQQPSVEQWIRNFRDSKFVVTDSFHGCVMSILFHVPFLCIINNGRGADRFKSLLAEFGLDKRIVSNNDLDRIVDNAIDWEHVDSVLAQGRSKSMEFLMNSLSKGWQ